MEKTGSTDNILFLIDRYNVNKLNIEKTEEILKEKNIFKQLTKELGNISGTKNIVEILGAERAMLKYEYINCPNISINKGRLTGLESAIKDLDKANEIVDMVRQPEQYKLQTQIISEHKIDKKNGLPRDAFHRFIDSHITRLRNKLISADASLEERKYTQERYLSMNVAKKEYMKLQSNALGIKLPEKSKERER